MLTSENVQLYIIVIKYVIIVMKISKRESEDVKLCPNIGNMDYTLHCKPILNLRNCRGFIIQTLSKYDQIVEGRKKLLTARKINFCWV